MTTAARPLLLYATDTEAIGGAEGYLRTLMLHADRERYRVGLVLPPRPGTQPLVELARAHGAGVAPFDVVHHEGLSPRAIARAAALLLRLRPTIVHFNLPSPRRCAEMIVASALVRVPMRLATFQLVTPVPAFGPLSGRLRALNRRLQYRALHHGIAVSHGNRRLLAEQYSFSPARLALIPNGVDTDTFRPLPDGGELRACWGVPPGVPLLGVVGRLSPQKGHAVLLDALPAVWAAFPDAHVALIGSGELEGELRRRASEIDPAERVHFVGQQARMVEALAALDVFVLPSRYEGLSFAVLEAMAAERPIVASAVDGTVEVVEDGRSGLLVPPGDSAVLADRIVRLLGDRALRERMGRAARRRVVEHYGQQRMLRDTFALYERA